MVGERGCRAQGDDEAREKARQGGADALQFPMRRVKDIGMSPGRRSVSDVVPPDLHDLAQPPLRLRRSTFGSQNRPIGIEKMRFGQVEMERPALADGEPSRPADPSDQLVLDAHAGKLGEDYRFCTQ